MQPREEPREEKREYTAEECSKARQALFVAVENAVSASGRPARRHGVEPLPSKFWATEDSDSESSVDEEIEVEEETDLTTPEFINEAKQAGFSMAELEQAENELSSSTPTNTKGTIQRNILASVLVQAAAK
ncbi:unnamed protein product [Urochloa humidicola]